MLVSIRRLVDTHQHTQFILRNKAQLTFMVASPDPVAVTFTFWFMSLICLSININLNMGNLHRINQYSHRAVCVKSFNLTLDVLVA